jgi:ABC-2 type transport system permease protein
MIRAYRSEWLKLIRRGMFLAALLMCAVAALGAWIAISRAKLTGDLTVVRLSQSDGFLQIMQRASDIISIFALGVVATAIALEYQQGTLRNLLVRQPDRLRLLTGKVAAITTWLGITLVVASGVALATALLTAPSRGLDTSAWFTGNGVGSTLGAFGGVTLAGIGMGLIGAALALMMRTVAPAIVIGIAWLLPIEHVLINSWSWMTAYLPGQALGAIAAGGNNALPFGHSVATAAVWVVGLVGAGAFLFRTRDVAT